MRRCANAPGLPHFDDLDPSGRYGDPTAPSLRITVLGDSSLTGPGLDHGSHVWVAQIADALPHDVDLRSHATGGSRVRDVLLRQAPAAVIDPPDLFVVAVGANDVMHATPTWLFQRDLEALLELLRAVAPVVTLGVGDLSVIPRLPPSLRPVVRRRCRTLDRLHARVTEERVGVTRLSIAETSDPHFATHRADIWVEDLFHPNRTGHAIWARYFAPTVTNAVDATHAVVDLRDGATLTPAT